MEQGALVLSPVAVLALGSVLTTLGGVIVYLYRDAVKVYKERAERAEAQSDYAIDLALRNAGVADVALAAPPVRPRPRVRGS